MEQLQDRLRADGSPGIHLGVGAANQRAQGFYAHLGWRELHADSITHTLGLTL